MLVIGNGESRKQLTIINPDIGCNAAYRDFNIKHLICVDKRMVNEALSSGFSNQIYTRTDWIKSYEKYSNVSILPQLPYQGNLRPDNPFHWGSGPYAVLLASTMNDNTIEMVGFDLYSQTDFVNNVYKDTKNYDTSSRSAIDHRYWEYQISKVFSIFKDKYFVIYNLPSWKMPESWKLANTELKTLDKFGNKI